MCSISVQYSVCSIVCICGKEVHMQQCTTVHNRPSPDKISPSILFADTSTCFTFSKSEQPMKATFIDCPRERIFSFGHAQLINTHSLHLITRSAFTSTVNTHTPLLPPPPSLPHTHTLTHLGSWWHQDRDSSDNAQGSL